MKDTPVVSSLRIKKLFGTHDLSIDFKKLNVIVGKNGLGKTTLLKIIRGLTTNEEVVKYQDICESIELTFTDGNVICYGTITDGMVKSAANAEVDASVFFEKENTVNEFLSHFEKLGDFSKKERAELARNLLQSVIKSEFFLKQASNLYHAKLKENRMQVFQNSWHIDKLKKNVNVRYISTVNISANAGNRMDLGNSIEKNILDLAIYDELRLLLKNGSPIVLDSFRTQLNKFLMESGKTVKRDHGEWIFINESRNTLRLDQLSSGERQLVYILATAANTYGKPTLFLMDEPEVSLHLSWQEKIIDAIMDIHPQMQIIAVTHSPGIIMNGHMDAYVEMKDIMQVSENV